VEIEEIILSDYDSTDLKPGNGKSLQVEAIKDGVVIDHIPATQGVKIIKSLNLFASKVRIAVGFNLPSKMMGLKDLIKIEHRQFNEQEVNRLAIFAPNATINIIADYKVVQKTKMSLPSSIHGLFICPNSNCISHNEPVTSSFHLSERQGQTILQCHYCEKSFKLDIFAEI